jgi:hypothetical protein
MGWGTGLSTDVLFTGCVNSTVNELYKHVNTIFGQFALSFEDVRKQPFKRLEQPCAAG